MSRVGGFVRGLQRWLRGLSLAAAALLELAGMYVAYLVFTGWVMPHIHGWFPQWNAGLATLILAILYGLLTLAGLWIVTNEVTKK